MHTVHDLIVAHTNSIPSNVAVSDVSGNKLTYLDLDQLIWHLAGELARRGINNSDRVALVMPDGPEMVVSFLAVSSVCACAPLNTRYKKHDFEFYLDDLQARAVILLEGMESSVIDVARDRNIPVWFMEKKDCGTGIQVSLKDSEKKSEGEGDPRWSGEQDVALILHTSGTTSRPKMVPLTHENLMTSAGNVARSLELIPDDIGLAIMPLFHIHGLVGALLSSVYAGSRIICSPGFDGERFLDWAREHSITWYSAVPTMHQAILDRVSGDPDAADDINLRLIRSSSASLPPKIFEELVKLWKAPVIESYGMTEAAHQMTSNPMPPHSQKPGSVGPAAGPEVAIIDDLGNPMPPGEKGPVCIRGRNVTLGYINNDPANQESFADGWFKTGDEGYFDGDGYLYLTGRLKEMINRGGENIAPREIDEALLEHPSVAQATAFSVPHPSLSEDVAAAVVLNPGMEGDESALREYLAAKLADFKIPTRIVFVESIPKGPTGKLQRIGLHEKLADKLEIQYLAPRSDTESIVVDIMGEILGQAKIGVNDNFFFLGGDSIRATRVLNRLKEKFGPNLPLTLVFTCPTAAELGHYLEEHTSTEADLDDLVEELSKLPPEEIKRLLGEEESS